MTARWPIPRPTEQAAIRAASRTARPVPPIEALFAALIAAYAVDDRHGLQLLGLAVVRSTGGPAR